MRISLSSGLGRNTTLDELIAQIVKAEQDGFAGVWLSNIFGFDALTALALAGQRTQRIEVGTAVVPTYPRHPVAMAQAALSAAAISRGRFSLGIGLSHQIVIEGMFGLSFAKPFSHMREYLAVLGPLVRTGQVSFAGDEFRVNANVAVPGASPCPILVAALAPKMLALAGRETDGTITWMTGPKTLREHTVPRICEAAAAAGRPTPRVVVGLPIAVTTNVASARASAAKSFQVYGMLPSYRAMLDREGAEGPANVAIVGDESAVRGALAALREAGVTDFLAAPFGVEGDRDVVARTRALLVDEIRRA
jgi:F420-dependent oxidoreductase-like protein